MYFFFFSVCIYCQLRVSLAVTKHYGQSQVVKERVFLIIVRHHSPSLKKPG